APSGCGAKLPRRTRPRKSLASAGAEHHRCSEHAAVRCLEQDGEPLAGARRINRDIFGRTVPGPKLHYLLDAVIVVTGAAGILAGADFGRAVADKSYQQNLARPIPRTDRNRAPVGGKSQRRSRFWLGDAERGQHGGAIRADHLTGTVDDELRGIDDTLGKASGIGALPGGGLG